jgi:hypothetical protein
MATISGHRVRIPELGKVVFPSSMTTDEVREAAQRLHQRAPAIRLGLALDHFDGSKSVQNDIYQRIIQFRKSAKTSPEEERSRLEKRIADYSNALTKHTQNSIRSSLVGSFGTRRMHGCFGFNLLRVTAAMEGLAALIRRQIRFQFYRSVANVADEL